MTCRYQGAHGAFKALGWGKTWAAWSSSCWEKNPDKRECWETEEGLRGVQCETNAPSIIIINYYYYCRLGNSMDLMAESSSSESRR